MKIYFNTNIYNHIKLPEGLVKTDLLEEAEVIVCDNRGFYVSSKKLKYIVCPCTNTDHITCSKKVKIISLKGETEFLKFVTSTAEHTVFLALLLLKRNSLKFDRRVEPSDHLASKVCGIIGYGRIGHQVYNALRGLGCQVVTFHDIKDNPPSNLDRLLGISDIIFCLVSVDKNSTPIINNDTIYKMKDQVYLINTARGAAVDEMALINNIKKFKGIAMDFGRVDALQSLHDNVIITPHYGGYTQHDIDLTFNFCISKLLQEVK